MLAKSDLSWEYAPSPIRFNELRNGEWYDARLEAATREWKQVRSATPPPGRMLVETLEPCRVMQTCAPVHCRRIDECRRVYDFGVNLTGWVEILVNAPSGSTITLRYAERINQDGSINYEHIAKFINKGEFQQDRYTASGKDAPERWHPRFTYHGFRYVEVVCPPQTRLHSVTAQFVHNAFSESGALCIGHPTLKRLQEITRQSFLSNFTGIPTDCPHREKNGWTGDAQLATETGLWNFDAAKSYRHFLQIVADTQSPSGQIHSIAPTSGFGFGLNPAWDFVLFEIPWQLYWFYNDTQTIRRFYDCLRRYLECCTESAVDGVLPYGLGDWCFPKEFADDSYRALCGTAYYYAMAQRLAEFARIIGNGEEPHYRALAAEIRADYRRAFSGVTGVLALGASLYFGLSDTVAEDAARLAQEVRAAGFKATFGILGAKFIPRVLADNGYVTEALNILTQPDYPGWGYWLGQGATTLWETWSGAASQNHIMFGDVSAWMYRYIGGIRPTSPGFATLTLHPAFAPGIESCTALYRSIHGEIRSEWKRRGDDVECRFEIPSQCLAEIHLGKRVMTNKSGTVRLAFSLQN
ncbi:MAG: family 78 glycoside hydrolase catalytic domain [Victivallaceae bacterium]|nr:family 78 glycoside hydrolase catalytic domain [Victivallaceae bacterium]